MSDAPTDFVPRAAFPDVLLGHVDTERNLVPAFLCRRCGGVWEIAVEPTRPTAQQLAAAGLALMARHLAAHERPLPIDQLLIAAFGSLVQ